MDSEFPQHVAVPDPPGPIRWAPVSEGGVVVGAVWCAVPPRARPRAGIVLAPDVEPSVLFQRELGELTMRVRSDSGLSATELLDYLAETRTGTAGDLSVGESRQARSVRAVHEALAWS